MYQFQGGGDVLHDLKAVTYAITHPQRNSRDSRANKESGHIKKTPQGGQTSSTGTTSTREAEGHVERKGQGKGRLEKDSDTASSVEGRLGSLRFSQKTKDGANMDWKIDTSGRQR